MSEGAAVFIGVALTFGMMSGAISLFSFNFGGMLATIFLFSFAAVIYKLDGGNFSKLKK